MELLCRKLKGNYSTKFNVSKIFTPSIPPYNNRSHVYILRLENNKWYVGYSKNVDNRIHRHYQGKGAMWTRLHKPISTYLIIEGDEDIEEFVTLLLMKAHGIENVRGGPWTSRDRRYLMIDEELQQCLEPEIIEL